MFEDLKRGAVVVIGGSGGLGAEISRTFARLGSGVAFNYLRNAERAAALASELTASGARVLTTLIHEMNRRDAKKGLATLCIGGGMGIAMCVERD